MENASEALMMAFGVMVLVIALTVSMVSFNRVKNVSDIVLYTADETNYYDYTGAKGKVAENRIVVKAPYKILFMSFTSIP